MNKFIYMLVLSVFILSGCGQEAKAPAAKTIEVKAKLPVVASFYPMSECTKAVGGELVEVQTMVGDGVEAHDWEPTAQDLTKLGQAKLFVYNGGVEHWAESALNAVKEKNVLGIEAGEKVINKAITNVDPHVWLSPQKAMIEVAAIEAALIKVDPANEKTYRENSAAYQKELEVLDAQLKEVAATAKKKAFVTTHEAFRNLAPDYGLEQVPIMGISPNAEPTPAKLKELRQTMKTKGLNYVFFETLVSPSVAKTVADASNAKTLVLDPIEGLPEEGRKQGDTYLKIMSRNIQNLQTALND